MLDEIVLEIDKLFLDPNNPRFVHSVNNGERVEDCEVERKQGEILRIYTRNSEADPDEDTTDIKDLYDSMKTLGYVPIDRIVVRPLENKRGYLVIEGNRRVSTIKTILKEYESRTSGFEKPQERQRIEPLLETFKSITCMLLETDGLSQEELQHKIAIILGLRHHGSLLVWNPLPKAFNIYKEYMNIEPKLENFTFIAKRRNLVAERLSVSNTIITSSLKTYIAYMQLSAIYDVREKHYSLIQSGVGNASLCREFLKIDESNYSMDEPTLERMNKACQFGYRDNMPSDKKKIMEDPKSFNVLSQLYKIKLSNTNPNIAPILSSLIDRALDENDTITLDSALDEAVSTVNQAQWAAALIKLLDQREKKLSYDSYTGDGNDLAYKEEAKKLLDRIVKFMEL